MKPIEIELTASKVIFNFKQHPTHIVYNLSFFTFLDACKNFCIKGVQLKRWGELTKIKKKELSALSIAIK